jgi:hypothetical protein
MDDLLKPVKTVRNVKSNIEKFETLSLRENQTKGAAATKRKILAELPNGPEGSTSPALTKSDDKEQAKSDQREQREKSEVGEEPIHQMEPTTKDVKDVEDVTRSEHGQHSNSDDSCPKPDNPSIMSPEQAWDVLKQQPTEDAFEAVMSYLESGIQKKHDFNLHTPSAPAAQILNTLVTDVIPDRWEILNSSTASTAEKAMRKSLLLFMRSTAGIGAVIARIQSLLTSPQIRNTGSSQHIVFKITAEFFGSMIYHKTFVKDLLFQTRTSSGKYGQEQAVWAETTSLLAGSKIHNVFLEASTISELRSEIPSWLQDAKEYSRWLGGNISSAAINILPVMEQAWKMLANLLKRALSLDNKGRSLEASCALESPE